MSAPRHYIPIHGLVECQLKKLDTSSYETHVRNMAEQLLDLYERTKREAKIQEICEAMKDTTSCNDQGKIFLKALTEVKKSEKQENKNKKLFKKLDRLCKGTDNDPIDQEVQDALVDLDSEITTKDLEYFR